MGRPQVILGVSALVVTGFMGMAIVAGLLWFLNETFHDYYATAEDAISDGAIDRGWIPRELPKSARDIYLKGDIDTGEVRLAFECDGGDIEQMVRDLRRLSVKEIRGLLCREYFNPSWWPPELHEVGLMKAYPSFRFEVYEGKEEWFAVERGVTARVFYWEG